jgi:hypothetical protein
MYDIFLIKSSQAYQGKSKLPGDVVGFINIKKK